MGVKVTPTPNFLYSIVITPVAPDCGTGIGTSPPTRNSASSPVRATRLGSARILMSPSSWIASTKRSRFVEPFDMVVMKLTRGDRRASGSIASGSRRLRFWRNEKKVTSAPPALVTPAKLVPRRRRKVRFISATTS